MDEPPLVLELLDDDDPDDPFEIDSQTAQVAGIVLVLPIAPPRAGDPTKCRPIGCYRVSKSLADQYRRDR